jgi:type II protein arginine methyltransferase
VSIWRLADKKKVWYEWFAESFYPLSPSSLVHAAAKHPKLHQTSSEEDATLGNPQRSESTGSVAIPPSPLIDAPSAGLDGRWGDRHHILGQAGSTNGPDIRVKIGQTTLHNPGGRSSWIGL